MTIQQTLYAILCNTDVAQNIKNYNKVCLSEQANKTEIENFASVLFIYTILTHVLEQMLYLF